MALPLVTFEGRVVGDPELRFAASGVAVCRFRTVSNSRKFDKETNEWKDDKTCWLDVTCFNKLAEHVAESIVNRDTVVVIGRIYTDEWEDKDSGAKRSKICMNADSVGPALTWSAAGHKQVERTSAPAEDDPWAGGSQDSAPPF